MGDIADMMIDGTLCEGCGVFLDGDSPGYPRYCSTECASDRGLDEDSPLIQRESYVINEEDVLEDLENAEICLEMCMENIQDYNLNISKKSLRKIITNIQKLIKEVKK